MAASRRLTPEQRRAELLAAALGLLDASGPDAVTPDAVAQRAGASRTLVLHYFGAHGGLRSAVGVAAVERLLAESTRTDDRFGERRVAARTQAYVASVAAHPTAARTVLRGPWASDPAVAEALHRLRDSLLDDLVGGALALGVPASGGLHLMARSWMALFEEAVIGWLAERPISGDGLVFLLEDSLARLVEWLGEPGVQARLRQASSGD